ncbi:ATP-dependent RNA helicase RhlE [bacterium BMS3Bbin10]|nr:ATP-dependent RNA helicase RhlE [bacterium BMS3Bbin10]
MTFEKLGLSEKALTAVARAGYETPTPIQDQAIPFVLEGRDVLGIAQTGTGKTASFVLPMLTRLERGRARARMPRSLILEPTRELAAQVVTEFETLGAEHKLTVALLIGGVSFDEQVRKLDRGADVLIATPGRLLDHFQRGKLLLTGVEIFVIDEADRMLDMGFIPDMERISKLIPPRRQTLFFSATMPTEIKRLADNFLNNPERIEATPPSTTVDTIEQLLCYTPSDPKQKRAALRRIMDEQKVKNAIVFCNRKRDVATLHLSLVKHGLNAEAIHGDLNQHQRMATLEAFRNGEVTYLIASDVAARGLDIPDVSHIFNYDVPVHSEDYVHRIGRTGRAGRKGCAVTLVTSHDMRMISAIQKLVRKDIKWLGDPPSAESGEDKPRSSRGSRRGGSGQRGSHGGRKRERGKSSSPEPKERKSASSERAAAEAPEKGKSRTRRDKPGRKAGKPGGKTVGLGDHVPDFLKRPAKPQN